MEKIAEALGVSTSTVDRDLGGFSRDGKKTERRGRPKLDPEQAAEAVHRVLDNGESMEAEGSLFPHPRPALVIPLAEE